MKHTFAFLLLCLAVGCTSPSSPDSTRGKTSTTPTRARPPAAVPQASQAAAFDVPALLGKNIEQVARQLGKSTGPDTPNLTVNEVERPYVRQGYKLVVTYDTTSRKVTGFVLLAPEPTGQTKDCRKLLVAGNLAAGNARYTVDSLAGDKEGYFIGLAILNE
ncbi:MAG: hypothetical protein EOO63_03360 [Hymenobacter sp.]|nr:MAG: hypothetical protein EOO63_03360 [Hymenobacter sp.]